jgi:uncharacterized membrane protein YphA (DoxX/SURF4 family)
VILEDIKAMKRSSQGEFKMEINDNAKYNGLILRVFLGLTVLFWGYEKLVIEKLTKSYTVDYGGFMPIDVQTFLQFAGWGQIIMGICLILGLLTRVQATIAVMMGLVTIIVPGLIIIQDVPHFAYAFAFTGGALVLFLEGSGPLSLDHWLLNKKPKPYRMSNNTVRTAPIDYAQMISARQSRETN